MSYNKSCSDTVPVCNPQCQNGGLCEFTTRSRTRCICPPEYRGPACEFYVVVQNTPCDRKDACLNGGSCIKANNPFGFICECAIGYTGPQCETYIGW